MIIEGYIRSSRNTVWQLNKSFYKCKMTVAGFINKLTDYPEILQDSFRFHSFEGAYV